MCARVTWLSGVEEDMLIIYYSTSLFPYSFSGVVGEVANRVWCLHSPCCVVAVVGQVEGGMRVFVNGTEKGGEVETTSGM